jgi:hypothetical protein
MGKGAYLGGSTVVGFSGSFTGKRGGRLTQATELDAHLTQKKARDEARKLAERPKRRRKKAASSRKTGNPKSKATQRKLD